MEIQDQFDSLHIGFLHLSLMVLAHYRSDRHTKLTGLVDRGCMQKRNVALAVGVGARGVQGHGRLLLQVVQQHADEIHGADQAVQVPRRAVLHRQRAILRRNERALADDSHFIKTQSWMFNISFPITCSAGAGCTENLAITKH